MSVLVLLFVIVLAAVTLWTLWTMTKAIGAAKGLDDLLINLGVLSFVVGMIVSITKDTPPNWFGWQVLLPTVLIVSGCYVWEHKSSR